MGVSERLKEYIKSKGLKVAEYERIAGFSNGAVNKMSVGSKASTYNRLSIASPDLNIDWLRTGRGEMILKGYEGHAMRISNDNKLKSVPVRFFSVTPTATFQEFCDNIDEKADYISYNNFDGDRIDQSSCIFEIYGESMAPMIQNHSKILCEEISTSRWHQIKDGVVVIAYADKFVIKRIIKNCLDSSNYIILASDNPEFPQQETVQRSDIRCIYKALRIISQQIF